MLSDLKLWALALLLGVGMTSCLKSDDSLRVYVQCSYILQNSGGTFTPQVRLIGEELQGATLNMEGRNFKFTEVTNMVWELTNSFYSPLAELDSVSAGYYGVTATNMEGKTTSASLLFDKSKKKIGEIELAKFEYLSADKKIEVELQDSVENASLYYLMIKEQTGSTVTPYAMWIPYNQLKLEGDKKLSATVSLSGLTSGKFRFAVGAAYGSTFRISRDTKDVDFGGTTTGQ